MYNVLTITMLAAATPSDPLSSLIGILFWVARCVILAIGGGAGLFLIVKGKTEESPREFQEGLFALIGSGALVAATFAVQALFK